MSTSTIQSFTVHQYISIGAPSHDDQVVITAARQIIQQCSSSAGWVDCILPPSEGDIVPDIHGLEEFKNIDLNYIWAKHSPEPELTRNSQSSSPVRPKKRRKLHTESLYSTIPQPHYLPSLPSSTIPQDNTPKYSKVPPIYISPHTSASVTSFLSTSYNRSSWVIPVRGCPPWPHCTKADVSSEISAPKGPGNADGILWTMEALRQFWTFLNSLREARTFGSIAISFYCVPKNEELSVPASNSSQSEPPSGNSAELRSIDHFKIYHDASVALSLRTLLDSWYWEPLKDVISGNTGRSSKNRIHVLRGAQFVCLDEGSRGILIL